MQSYLSNKQSVDVQVFNPIWCQQMTVSVNYTDGDMRDAGWLVEKYRVYAGMCPPQMVITCTMGYTFIVYSNLAW